MLEDAADTGQFVPGAKGWRQQQTQIVEEYLAQPDESGPAPLARIHAARKEAWLDQNRRPPDERALLEHALTAVESGPPSPSDASAAIEPLIWLLQQLADGVKLTQTGALPRSIVRAAVERYPNWWDTPTVGPPYQEAEVYPLGILHDLVDNLSLARRHRGILQLTPKGRQALDDPQTLLTQVADMLGPNLPSELDPELARYTLHQPADEISWTLDGILAPFNGTILHDRISTSVSPTGRTLTAAILHARAHGPRTTLT
jgi:hypothetical protein